MTSIIDQSCEGHTVLEHHSPQDAISSRSTQRNPWHPVSTESSSTDIRRYQNVHRRTRRVTTFSEHFIQPRTERRSAALNSRRDAGPAGRPALKRMSRRRFVDLARFLTWLVSWRRLSYDRPRPPPLIQCRTIDAIAARFSSSRFVVDVVVAFCL